MRREWSQPRGSPWTSTRCTTTTTKRISPPSSAGTWPTGSRRASTPSSSRPAPTGTPSRKRWARGSTSRRPARAGSLTMHDAALTLDSFMEDGQPDRRRFEATARRLLAGADGKPVRAFGEMVALLWEQGNVPAAIRARGAVERPARARTALGVVRLPHHRVDRRLAGGAQPGLPPPLEGARAVGLRLGTAVPQEERWPGLDDLVDLRSTVFVPTAEAVGATRRFVAAILETWGLGRLEWDAALVVSELANNAVCHGGLAVPGPGEPRARRRADRRPGRRVRRASPAGGRMRTPWADVA